MSNLGFVDKYFENANKFYELAMNQYDFYLKIMGIDILIIRVKENAIRKEVYGAVYSSDLLNDEDLIKIKYRIIINLNDMRKIWSKVADSFEVYDNRNVLQMGDIVQMVRRDNMYRFKVTNVESFSESERIIYRYYLQGYQEVKL